jgi:L-asparaginase
VTRAFKNACLIALLLTAVRAGEQLTPIAVSGAGQPGPPAATRPKIMFLTTGGTIQHKKMPEGGNSRIDLEETITNIRTRYPQPEVAKILDGIAPSFKEITLINGADFDLREFLTIAWEAQKALDADFDAVIVTQGTVSSEYTCYFLQLLVRSSKPVVLTNSQRQHMSVGNDGDRNLLDSIVVASDPDSRGKGALQVEGAKISSCREVVKTSSRPGAFMSGNLGVLGWVQGGTLGQNSARDIGYYRSPTRRHTADSAFSIKDLVNPDGSFKPLPRVEVLPSYYGARTDVIDALVKLDVQGLVVEGLPPGRIFKDQQARLAQLAAGGMPIVVTSVDAGAYDGSGVEPVSGPIVSGDNLPAHKARILLQLAMEKTQGLNGQERLDEIERIFDTH